MWCELQIWWVWAAGAGTVKGGASERCSYCPWYPLKQSERKINTSASFTSCPLIFCQCLQLAESPWEPAGKDIKEMAFSAMQSRNLRANRQRTGPGTISPIRFGWSWPWPLAPGVGIWLSPGQWVLSTHGLYWLVQQFACYHREDNGLEWSQDKGKQKNENGERLPTTMFEDLHQAITVPRSLSYVSQ